MPVPQKLSLPAMQDQCRRPADDHIFPRRTQ
jgi:hypothetical protein